MAESSVVPCQFCYSIDHAEDCPKRHQSVERCGHRYPNDTVCNAVRQIHGDELGMMGGHAFVAQQAVNELLCRLNTNNCSFLHRDDLKDAAREIERLRTIEARAEEAYHQERYVNSAPAYWCGTLRWILTGSRTT